VYPSESPAAPVDKKLASVLAVREQIGGGGCQYVVLEPVTDEREVLLVAEGNKGGGGGIAENEASD
jgi:hypothetical protein